MIKFKLKIFSLFSFLVLLFVNSFLPISWTFNSGDSSKKNYVVDNGEVTFEKTLQNLEKNRTDKRRLNYFPSLGEPKPNVFTDSEYPIVKIEEIKKDGLYIPAQEVAFFATNESRYFAETVYKYFAITPKELVNLPYEQYQYLNVFVQAHPNPDYTIDWELISHKRQEIFRFALDFSYEQILDIISGSLEIISFIMRFSKGMKIIRFILDFIAWEIQHDKQLILSWFKLATYESFENTHNSDLQFYLNAKKDALIWRFKSIGNLFKYRNIAELHLDFVVSNTLDEFVPEIYKNCSWWQLKCHVENIAIGVRNTANHIKHMLDLRLDSAHLYNHWKKDLISSNGNKTLIEKRIDFDQNNNFAFRLADLKLNQANEIIKSNVDYQKEILLLDTRAKNSAKKENIFDHLDDKQPLFWREKRKDKNVIKNVNPRFKQEFFSPIDRDDQEKYQLVFNPRIISLKNYHFDKKEFSFSRLLNFFDSKHENSFGWFLNLLQSGPFRTLYQDYLSARSSEEANTLFLKFVSQLKTDQKAYEFYNYWNDISFRFINLQPDKGWNFFLNDHFLNNSPLRKKITSNFVAASLDSIRINFASLNLENLFTSYQVFESYPLTTVFADDTRLLANIDANSITVQGKIIKPQDLENNRKHLEYLPVSFKLNLEDNVQAKKLKTYLSQFTNAEIKQRFRAFSFVTTSFYGDIIPLAIF